MAFALATPMRVRELLAFAIREAIGARAPQDKFARTMMRTLAGLCSGDFCVDINGRLYSDSEAVVVCEGTVDVRFFLKRRHVAGIESSAKRPSSSL